MELLQLNYFRVVARVEHITKAAEELYIAQPSLSKTIRRLEKELGVPLFDRQGRNIRLNQFGSAFLEHIENMFAELEEGQRKIRDMAGLEHGEVSLVATSLHWLPDLLHGFQLLYPSVHVRLSQCSAAEMPQQLETGAYDFSFMSMPLVKSGIAWRPLLTEEILLVVPRGHRLAERSCVALGDVADEMVIVEQAGGDLRSLVESYCREAGFSPHISYEVDEPAALLEFVKGQLGVTFVPALAQKRIDAAALIALHVTNPKPQRTFGMAWYEAHYLSQAAVAFRQFTTEFFTKLG